MEILILSLYKVTYNILSLEDKNKTNICKSGLIKYIIANDILNVINYPFYLNESNMITEISHIELQKYDIYVDKNSIKDSFCKLQIWKISFTGIRTIICWASNIRDAHNIASQIYEDLTISYICKDSRNYAELAITN